MSYLSEVLADSPVHFWRMADPGGSVCHDIGSTPHHLFLVNPLGATGLGWSGPISDGGSLCGTANAGSANSGDALATYTTPFSFECWMWVGFGMATNVGIAMSNQSVSALFYNAGLWSWSGGVAAVTSATHATERAWHHLVGTLTTSTATLYVDGSSVASGTGASRTVNDFLYVQENSSAGQNGNGAVAEVAIYGSALSAARVSAHFAAADNVLQDPVYSRGGGTGGSGAGQSNPNYIGLLQEILQAVRKTFPTT